MQIRDELEKAIHGPIQRTQDAERIRRAAELLGEYLLLEDRARRVLGGLPADESPATDLRGVSLDDAAERVLEEAGVPLHVRELGARIKARGWRHPRSKNARPDQILYQLAARLPRHPDRFRRVSPNTFGLSNWEGGQGRRSSAPAPRTSLFHGGGRIGARIAESDEPVTNEEAEWRSS